MLSPKEVIEKIRRIRFGIGLNTIGVPEDIRAHIEDNKKFKDDAARLVSDLHTKKPHFVLEVIQNAEDNEYNKGVKPRIRFIILENQIILQNNEKGFEESNVDALCSIGGSTKRDKRLGYIGEKGIGFKSVFRITNNPKIFSNGFNFEFKYDPKEPSSIIIPHLVEDLPSFIEPSETNIILPLKDEIKKDLAQYIRIDPRLILFLKKIGIIEIQSGIKNKPEVIELSKSAGKIKIEHPKEEEYYKIVKNTESLKVPSYIKEEKRKDVAETEIILAFPLESDGSAKTSTEQEIFVYLPVRSYGFRFIIQADFLMPPTREDIYEDKTWNKWLRDEIPNIFLRAIDEFKQDRKLKKTYYNYIPLANEINDEFFSPVVSQIYGNLQESECILTESGNWKRPTEVFRANIDIRNLIADHDLKKLLGKEYISSNIKISDLILNALQVPEFEFNHLIQCLQNTEWLKQQNDKWFVSLYTYLNSQNIESQIENLKKLKILRLENNELVSITEKSVFSPLDKEGDYGFEKELRILKRTIFEPKEKKIKVAVGEFLKKIGVQDASPHEIIENHILPIYERDDWKSKGSRLLLGYIRYIKDNLPNYEKESDKRLNANKKYWETKEDALKRLKKSLFIRINKTGDSTSNTYYAHPKNIYLPREFGNENDLEILFEGINDVIFIHREYADDIIKKYRQLKRKRNRSKVNIRRKREEEIKEWKKFFLKLGVSKGLKVVDDIKSFQPDGYLKKDISPDCSLEYFDNIISTKDSKKISKLIILIEGEWQEIKKRLNRQIASRPDGRYSFSYENVLTKLYIQLIMNEWLLTTKGTFARPSEVFLNKPEIKDILGDSVPYLAVNIKNEELIKALMINANATVEGVLNYLKSLTKQKSEEKLIFTKLYDFLNKNYDTKSDTIEKTFSENQLIFIPRINQKYFASQEVLWKDVSDILGENRGYLETHYQDLKSFFVDKLGVSEKPSPKDYADVLIDLSSKEKPDSKGEKIILKIYKELNNHLNPENNEHLISEEKWWNDLIIKPIFWTDKGEFWKNDNDIFINDNQEIYELFRDSPQVAFIELPKNYHPKIQYFIKASKIPYLSEAVKAKMANVKTPKFEMDLTEQIRKFFPFILRYLYQTDHETYEMLKKSEILTQVKNLTCHSVESLQVEYILNQQSAFILQKTFFNEDDCKLYIQNDSMEDVDHLAMAFSESIIIKIKGIEDFLILLFMKKTHDKIEKLLKAKGIQELPDDEQKWLEILSEKPEPGLPEEPEQHPEVPEPPEAPEITPSKTESGLPEEPEQHPEVPEPPEASEITPSKTESGLPEEPEQHPEVPEPPEASEITPPKTESGLPEEPEQHPEVPEPPEAPEITPPKTESGLPEEPEKHPEVPEPPEAPEITPPKTESGLPEEPEQHPEVPEPQEMVPFIPPKIITELQIRNSFLAKWVKENYGYHCQICLSRENPELLSYKKSYSGRIDNRRALMRGHHIKRLRKDEGHDHPGNYFSLCHSHHKLIHKIGFKLEDLIFSLNNMEKRLIKWPDGVEVDYSLVTFSDKFKEDGFKLKLVITSAHLEQIKKYIGFLKI